MLRRLDQSGIMMSEPNRSVVLPDLSRLADFPANGTDAQMAHGHTARDAVVAEDSSLTYENSDIQEITRRQLKEDIMAYRYDLDLCRSLVVTDVTPQEARSLQLRTLDIGHQIRSAQHRIELIEARQRRSQMPSSYHNGIYSAQRASVGYSGDSPSGGSAVKRQRLPTKRSHSTEGMNNSHEPSSQLHVAVGIDRESFTPVNGYQPPTSTEVEVTPTSHAVQRLGFWKCRLCVASKYLNAGPNRVPSEPSKWPLKDISKMLNHFLDLHTEHTPAQRCQELGAALAQNRGPFEYWLTQTRKQDLDDLSVIDGYVNTLQDGSLPEGLRRLNRAAGLFPNSIQEK